MDDEQIFKALADDTRRKLLDLLFQQDGQTLLQLCSHFEMTRHGVMKHLQILEDAELVITEKVGREKFHYLNPIPIQEAYNRWVSKYAQPFAHGLNALKHILEGTTMSAGITHIYQTYIRTTPERLWQALTDGTFTQQYYMAARVESDWQAGSTYRYVQAGKNVMVEGDVVEADPPRKLVTTFNAMWMPEAERGEPTTVIFEIEALGGLCKLKMSHIGLNPSNALSESVQTGWAQVLSGLKSLLETGEPLNFGS
ncbi:MAG: ArsR/SmtB family transcription factor [Phototrophicaceae bacterium]|jgi:uncharacterized protein YndB with AHSA1/START domain/DNA-binding transcriptional ArsR family regulator